MEKDLPMEAVGLAADLENGHYAMSDAVAMIRKLALALDDELRAKRRSPKTATTDAA